MSKLRHQKLGATLRYRVMAAPLSLSTAVDFLEADPWFHGSGYIKANLIRFINSQEMKTRWSQRLRRVVIAAVEREDRREFRSYCRLACKIDTPELREELKRRLEHQDKGVRRRARWVLDYLLKHPAPPLQRQRG